jgi:hypothetical protein
LISPPRLDLPEEGVGRSAASWGIQRVRSYVHVVQSTSSALRAFRAEPAFSMARPNRHGLGGHAVRRRLKHVWVCFRTHGPPAGYAALIRTRSVKRKKRKRKSECAKIGRFRNPSHAGSASAAYQRMARLARDLGSTYQTHPAYPGVEGQELGGRCGEYCDVRRACRSDPEGPSSAHHQRQDR